MMSKAELEVLVQKYEDKADRAYRNYQDTGISRYDRERRNAETMADAFRMAAGASDDYAAMIHLRADLVEAAYMARAAMKSPDENKSAEMEKVLKTVEAMAVRRGLVREE